jgi:hypothetical protein
VRPCVHRLTTARAVRASTGTAVSACGGSGSGAAVESFSGEVIVCNALLLCRDQQRCGSLPVFLRQPSSLQSRLCDASDRMISGR